MLLTTFSLEGSARPAKESGIHNTTAQPAEGGEEKGDRFVDLIESQTRLTVVCTSLHHVSHIIYAAFTRLRVDVHLTLPHPFSCITAASAATTVKAQKKGKSHLPLSYLVHHITFS